MNLDEIKNELANTDLFIDWDLLLVELVASVVDEKTYQKGEVIFDENARSRELYIIADGEVEIHVHPAHDDSHEVITTLRRGQNFGEIALLDEGRRTATAVCSGHNTHLLVIERDKLIKLCDNVPRLGYKLMYSLATDLATKIRSTDLKVWAQLTWVPAKDTQNR